MRKIVGWKGEVRPQSGIPTGVVCPGAPPRPRGVRPDTCPPPADGASRGEVLDVRLRRKRYSASHAQQTHTDRKE